MSKRKSTTEETSAREPALPEVPAIQETPPATEPADYNVSATGARPHKSSLSPHIFGSKA